ncbi:Fur family transcriptional regulator [Murimonas intestini]|uniref:Fur family peroxide stress response transcriptional regulator n=1 Tax=Murimonas intestini TaxID=1337051 RepID=A0AB73SYC9_9FIRM|nr:transcriptional repressor [Murimonas intestini]MCR1840249.1 transcriptional repressor [Murimonas intestini]MCR1868286.1 transcriptional repressor [Murimonas intestini]MCR1885636.1 transcriptional repressor [Murimonas intestini]
MPKLKYSKQRESIKEFLASRTDHPTADTVYMNIRETFPNISLGTVYRNLSLLSDIGEIMKITTGDGADRFDGNTTPHNHFVCTECHSVIDLEMDSIDNIVEIAGRNFDGHIAGYVTNFYGVCGDCIKKS